MARILPCTPDVRRGRLRKAGHFLDAANLIADQAGTEPGSADVFITLCIHAGIAASDVICCARLGQHAQGEKHNKALALLGQADSGSVKHMRVLLSMKTKAGYSHAEATAADAKRAGRAAETLVETDRRGKAGGGAREGTPAGGKSGGGAGGGARGGGGGTGRKGWVRQTGG